MLLNQKTLAESRSRIEFSCKLTLYPYISIWQVFCWNPLRPQQSRRHFATGPKAKVFSARPYILCKIFLCLTGPCPPEMWSYHVQIQAPTSQKYDHAMYKISTFPGCFFLCFCLWWLLQCAGWSQGIDTDIDAIIDIDIDVDIDTSSLLFFFLD